MFAFNGRRKECENAMEPKRRGGPDCQKRVKEERQTGPQRGPVWTLSQVVGVSCASSLASLTLLLRTSLSVQSDLPFMIRRDQSSFYPLALLSFLLLCDPKTPALGPPSCLNTTSFASQTLYDNFARRVYYYEHSLTLLGTGPFSGRFGATKQGNNQEMT